jgi:NAD-dependent deacetylase
MATVVVFTGSGISAESGLKTFRDEGGLWENHRVEDVATPEAWERDRRNVLAFYNERRRQVIQAVPNAAHLALAALQQHYTVHVITQNIDDLHERAGSRSVVHLHGEIRKARSTADPSLIYDLQGWELKEGDRCETGSQLRPHIVWFGELVPELGRAADLAATADIFIVIGTSLLVYPAAGLIHAAPARAEKYFIDPLAPASVSGFHVLREKAGTGMPQLATQLMNRILA